MTNQILKKYNWEDKVEKCYRDEWDNTRYYFEEPERSLTLREDIIGANHEYEVSFSAQILAGRHAKTVDTKSYELLDDAKDSLLELAKKYAPQDIIDKIEHDLGGI